LSYLSCVIFALRFPVLFGRDRNLPVRIDRRINDRSIIATPCPLVDCPPRFNRSASLGATRRGACRNSHRHAAPIRGQTSLGVEPPFVRALSGLPPRAPAPWGWPYVRIDRRPFTIGVIRHCFRKTPPDALAPPAAKAPPCIFPIAMIRRQTPPGSADAQDPERRVDGPALVADPSSPSAFGPGKRGSKGSQSLSAIPRRR
jgi:hypothetical protein